MTRVKITDRLLVLVLFVVMGVLSVVQVVNLNENTKQTNRLTTTLEGDRRWSEVVALCILDTSGAVNTGTIPYTREAISVYVSDCFKREGERLDAPLANDTTTTGG